MSDIILRGDLVVKEDGTSFIRGRIMCPDTGKVIKTTIYINKTDKPTVVETRAKQKIGKSVALVQGVYGGEKDHADASDSSKQFVVKEVKFKFSSKDSKTTTTTATKPVVEMPF